MKELKLVLKKKWYDMIVSGIKKEEYREIKPYWTKRLTELPMGFLTFSYRNRLQEVPYKLYDIVTFYLGYAKDRPSMSFRCVAIEIGKGKPEWGAVPDKKYFIIHLGEEITL